MRTAPAMCPICCSKRMYYTFSVGHSRLVQCRQCSHMMLHPPPTEEELDQIYSNDYWLLNNSDDDRLHFAQLKRATAWHYLDLIGRCLGRHGGRLLEVGCGAGDLLAAAAELGYDVTGVERSEDACIRARERLEDRARVLCGGIGALTEKNFYDVCVLADVIEHFQEPRGLLKLLWDLLTPGGLLMVVTPTLDSWSARVMRNRWMEFKTEHLHYFTQETLHSLLFQTGFEPIAALPGHKYLSVDYIAEHFRKYPIRLISSQIRLLSAVLPRRIRRRPFRVVASGIISISVKRARIAQRKVSIIVPVYNEAATLGPVLQGVMEKELDGVDKEVVIVESNSTDGTRDVVLKYQHHPNVKIVLEDGPRGKGHAVRAGLAHATGEYILIQDGDQEYDIEDYDVLIEPLVSGTRALILGSRHGGRTWKVRQFKGKPLTGVLLNLGHWIFKTAVNVTLGLKLDDPFTMYKVFRRDCISGLVFECNRFDFDYELLIKIVRKGYRPIEIPVNYRSRSFSEGKKVLVVRDPWTWIRAIFKYRWGRLDVIEGWRSAFATKSADTPPVVIKPRPSTGWFTD